jgi:hypothetical protein
MPVGRLFLLQAAVGLGFLSRGVRLDALVQTATMSDIAQKAGDLPVRPYNYGMITKNIKKAQL